MTPPNAQRADDLRRSIHDALNFSGVLVPLADEAFLGAETTRELSGVRRTDCADWTQSGADALVEGRIYPENNRLACGAIPISRPATADRRAGSHSHTSASRDSCGTTPIEPPA